MNSSWKKLRTIIGTYESHKEIFLSLIDEKGKIVCANSTMKRTLHLKNEENEKTNFFDLLHPVNLLDFKKVIGNTTEKSFPQSMEIYLKNGYYHPMKWQVNYLEKKEGVKTYLCLGHKILDDKRMRQFNMLGEKNYQLIVESINAGILFQDRDGELISVNQKMAEVFNSTLERFYKLTDIRTLWNTWKISAEDGSHVLFDETPFMKALKTGKPQSQVLIITLRNGESRWLHFSSQPLFDDSSADPYSVVSNIADLTYEKKLVQEIEKRKALFRSFMGRTPNMAWVVDEDSVLVFASNAFYRYFQLDEKDAIDKKLIEIIPSGVVDALYQKHQHVFETGEPVEMIEKVSLANGADYVFHINIFPIEKIGEKKLLGGHAVNVAEKYTIEKKLRETNDRLLLLTRATSDAIWEWDMQTGYIFRNDALMDMIGYQVDDPRGLSWWLRRIHPEDRNRVSDKVKESTDNSQQSWQDEYRFKCADGNYKFMRDKGFIVYENGLPVKMIGSLQDVSDLKQLEMRLTEEKLERQKEISEMVIHVQEKERARIGHELHDNVNQILSTTKLFVDMLTPVDKKQAGFKEKSLEYIMMAIEEIRKLSKELVVPHLKNESLFASIESLVADIHLSTKTSIAFTHDTENDLLSPGKKVAFFRIVQEQLKNILKHSKARNVEILMHTKDNDVFLIIKDDGVGFEPGQTQRGIGLSNIYERTRFYNGQVEIETAPEKGCTISVRIPAS